MVSILVTGANGQLGSCIKKIEKNYLQLNLCFLNSNELDISKENEIRDVFEQKKIDFVINCAAYTNVEKSEKEPEKAFLVNADGVRNLAHICDKYNTTLIHISTDYVFDGTKRTPYIEEDIPNPINEYGKSKLNGEKHVQELLSKYFIIRTSWLYSEFGHNFFKTILKKSEIETELCITTSETGTPTNANDLAQFILDIIKNQSQEYGIYHYSNLGKATWYDFAKEILSLSGKLETIQLKKTDNYVTFARRPGYSVLNTLKAQRTFELSQSEWSSSLDSLINK